MSAVGMRSPGISGSRSRGMHAQLAAALLFGAVTVLGLVDPAAAAVKTRKPHKLASKTHSPHSKRTAHSKTRAAHAKHAKKHPAHNTRTAKKAATGHKPVRTAARHTPLKHTRIARKHSPLRIARRSHDPEKLIMPEGDGSPVLELAAQFLGRPYRFGSDYGAFDCSGFVRRVFLKVGVDLPHSAREQFTFGDHVSRNDLEPGDLVFFRNGRRHVTHVGIYVGDDKFVHAASHGGQVQVDSLDESYYAHHYIGARRIEI
ncbi:MAG: C40 family peptidase [Candidatus Binatia bacterium]